MKKIYRNFELDTHKEKSLAGYLLLYFAIYDKDGYEWVCGFEDSVEKVVNKIDDLEKWVDEFYENIKNKICSDCYEELDDRLYCKFCDLDYNKYIK
ncbi:MAG TPA: hypothetical protein GX530_06950 [Corynebacteriales bacterium]|nr:hypothetical protein [Mycobacteriales bacterium]